MFILHTNASTTRNHALMTELPYMVGRVVLLLCVANARPFVSLREIIGNIFSKIVYNRSHDH